MSQNQQLYTAKSICQLLHGDLYGDENTVVNHLAKIEEAEKNSLCFISNPKYLKYLPLTKAGIIITSHTTDISQNSTSTFIKVDDPYIAFTKLMQAFEQKNAHEAGIDKTAVIHDGAKIDETAFIGALTVISKSAIIGKGAYIHPQVFIGENVVIGDHTTLHPGARIYKDCIIGSQCIIHSNTVIGSDGFGYAPTANGRLEKIPQTGNVVIHDFVEIGSGCTIDRASLGSTIIRNGAKLDNLIQIAHGVDIGENTVIAAQTGVSGSTKIEKNCQIGGQVGFVGHIKVAEGTKINAKSGISKSIKTPYTQLDGNPAQDFTQNMKSKAIFRRLPDLEKRILELEQIINELKTSV